MVKAKLAILLVLFAVAHALGQRDNVSVPLKTILAAMEKQHHIHFNYLEGDIVVYRMIAPIMTVSLEEKLRFIEQRTALRFANDDYDAFSISKITDKEPSEIKASQELQEVVISNYLTTGISKKTDGAFLISPKKFGILPGLTEADVLQAMQQIPGIISVDETVSNINVRGGTHDQNLFLWNGIRMFQTGHFFGQISAFNPSLPHQISIQKNGSSAFYGESVSSVVAISTTFGNVEKSEFGVGTNLISAETYAKLKVSENALIALSGRRSFTDLFVTPTYKSYSGRVFQNTVITNIESNETVNYSSSENFYFYDFTLQYQQQIGRRHAFTAGIIGISNVLDVAQRKSDSSGIMLKNSHLDQQNFGGNVSWKTNWSAVNSTSFSGYGSYYNLAATNQSVENSQIVAQQNSVLDTGLRLEHQHQFSSTTRFSAGYQLNETGISSYDNSNIPFFSRKITNVLRTHALIGEAQFQSNDKKIFIKTGLRINYFGKFDIILAEPRLHFRYAPTTKFGIEISGELKSQTASQIIDLQQDFLGLEKRRWTLSDNRENPIQKSAQISFGITYKCDGWLVVLENFYKKVDGISSPGQSFQNQLEFERIIGRYNIYGSEILVQKNFGHFYSWMSYTFNNNEYTFQDFAPRQFASNFEIAQTVSWAGIYECEKLKLALGAKWYTGKPITTPMENLPDALEIHYNNPNNTTLSDYFQVNFSAFYKKKLNEKVTLHSGFSILNILNKKNTINRYYRRDTSNNSIERVNTYALGPTPNLSIHVYF